ncbi:MAG: hypothetical protein FJY99_03135 [Candidatus Sericytochromatia bacterium]|nr:hypothetical protein [Candidatus Tanganyikabacteria bacterium]
MLHVICGASRTGRIQLPLVLSSPDGGQVYKGVSAELDARGLVFIAHDPVAWHGFEPMNLALPCPEGLVTVKVHWEIRGHARVWRLDFVAGQEDVLSGYRQLLADAAGVATGRTTRRVTEPRRDEAATIRRMLRRIAGSDRLETTSSAV